MKNVIRMKKVAGNLTVSRILSGFLAKVQIPGVGTTECYKGKAKRGSYGAVRRNPVFCR